MFKAVLIIYVVGIGQSGDDNSGALNATAFETMQQCEAAIVHAKDVIDDWHYGDDKSNIVPLKRTMKCFPIPAGPAPEQKYNFKAPEEKECPRILGPGPSVPEERLHRRWDDP